MFVRVKDKSTGHEFDVPESDPRIDKAFTPLSKKQYPPSVVVRRPKHNVGRKTASVTPDPSKAAEKSKEENNNGSNS